MPQSEQRPHRAASGPVLDEDERGELERLRGEVAALRAAPAPRRARIRSASLAAAFLLVLGCVDVVTGAVVGSLGSAHWGWRARRSLPSPCRAWFSLFWRCGCMIIEAFRSRRGGREAAAMLLRERSALGAVVGVRSCSSCRRRPAHGSATARPARRRVHPAHRARGTDRPRMRSLGCDSGSAPCPSRDRMHGLTSVTTSTRGLALGRVRLSVCLNAEVAVDTVDHNFHPYLHHPKSGPNGSVGRQLHRLDSRLLSQHWSLGRRIACAAGTGSNARQDQDIGGGVRRARQPLIWHLLYDPQARYGHVRGAGV